MDSVSATLWSILMANIDKLDLAALCGNSADWAGVVVRKSLDKLDKGFILQLCGNPAAWAGEVVVAKFDSDSNPDVPQLVVLCGNPGDWAGEIVAAIRKRSIGGVCSSLLTAECTASLCGNPATWAKEVVFGMENQLTITSACVVAACGNPTPWARTIVLRGRSSGLINAQCNEALCANEAEWASTVIRRNVICRERYLKRLCSNPAPWVSEAVKNLRHIMIRNHTRDLCENSGEWAKEILTQEFKRGREVKAVWIAPLCGNSAEWAGIMVDSMFDSPKLLDFHRLSMNSALWAIKKLLEHSDKIDFHAMSANRFPLEPNLNEPEAELDPTSNETSAGMAYHKIVTYNAIEQKLFVGYFGAPTKPSNETFELLDAAICANPKLAEGLLGDKPLGRLHTLREEHNRLVHAVTVSAEDGIMALNAEAGDNDEEAVNLVERYHQLEDEAAKLRSTISDWEGALAVLAAKIGRKKEVEAVNRVRLQQMRVLMDEEAEEERELQDVHEEAERQQRKIREEMERKRRELEQNRAARHAKAMAGPTNMD